MWISRIYDLFEPGVVGVLSLYRPVTRIFQYHIIFCTKCRCIEHKSCKMGIKWLSCNAQRQLQALGMLNDINKAAWYRSVVSVVNEGSVNYIDR